MPFAKKVMALTRDVLTFALSLLSDKFALLAFDPWEPRSDKRSDSVVFHIFWGSHTNTSGRRQNGEMQILDRLADD
jgi:hypothetical protein